MPDLMKLLKTFANAVINTESMPLPVTVEAMDGGRVLIKIIATGQDEQGVWMFRQEAEYPAVGSVLSGTVLRVRFTSPGRTPVERPLPLP